MNLTRVRPYLPVLIVFLILAAVTAALLLSGFGAWDMTPIHLDQPGTVQSASCIHSIMGC